MDYTNYDYTTSSSSTGVAVFGGVWLLFWLAFAVLSVVAMWKIFKKAGKQGWEAIVPIYNVYVLLQIVGRPAWWLLLFLIPFVNIVVSLVVAIDLAKSFGKDPVFGVVALWLFSIVGYLMLGFGDAKYVGPAAAGGSGAKPAAPAQPAA